VEQEGVPFGKTIDVVSVCLSVQELARWQRKWRRLTRSKVPEVEAPKGRSSRKSEKGSSEVISW